MVYGKTNTQRRVGLRQESTSMKIAASGLIAAAVAVVASTASAQSNTGSYQYQVPSFQGQTQTQTYQVPSFQQTQTYQAPNYQTQQGQTTYGTQGSVTYGAPTTQEGSVTYGTLPNTGTVYGGGGYQQQPSYQQPNYQAPQPQPYFPGIPTQINPGFPSPPVVTPGFPPPPPPANPNPAPQRGEIPDTDAWTFAVARYYPAIKACLRNTKVKNPVIANVQERRNATVMLIGQGGTAEYQVCRTGLNGTRVREGKSERGLPPAFYAPNGSSFTITPDRPFQPVVDTGQRLLGWIVRTQPVRLDVYGGGRGFDGQFIKPVTVNPDAQ